MVVDGGQRRSDVLLAPLRFAFHARRTAREADSAVTAWAESRRRTDNHETQLLCARSGTRSGRASDPPKERQLQVAACHRSRIWKLYGSLSAADSTRSRPQTEAETQELPADTPIRPAAARTRAHFASRRSPVRSRLASLEGSASGRSSAWLQQLASARRAALVPSG